MIRKQTEMELVNFDPVKLFELSLSAQNRKYPNHYWSASCQFLMQRTDIPLLSSL
jgi:hypothetical protein